MTVWERERVLALVPSSASQRAAVELATPGRWTSLGASEQAVWGRCRGSAALPYETVAALDRAGSAFTHACSCPSRRSPCKHVVGLMLLRVAGQVPVVETEADFAATWLQRSRRVDPPADESPADPEAAARRVAVRAERVSAGLDDLDRWLRDQIRGGLAGLERAGYPHFDRIAARMVDAQAPGVAGLLRSIPAELADDDWPERVLDRLAALHLLIQAHRRLAALPPELAANVRSRVGYPVAKGEVAASRGVADRWLALGMVDSVESQLESRRVWLHGSRTGRWALWLSFAAPGANLDATVLPGQVFDADLHFYPGSSFRVLLAEHVAADGDLAPVPVETLGEVRQRFARLLAEDPWATRLPAVVAVAPIPPQHDREPWRLRDTAGRGVNVMGLSGEPWLLLARSGGEPVEVFGEWSAAGFRPLSVLADRWGQPFSTGVAV